MGPVLVFGHRNPDNDSICSAVGYAHLKNLTDPEQVFVPARLGEPPAETVWAFEKAGVDLPELITHVRVRVRDVMTEEVFSVGPQTLVLDAGRTLREHDVRSLPVVRDGAVVGLVTLATLAGLYIEELEVPGFSQMPVSVGQLMQALDGELLAGDEALILAGNVLIGAMEPNSMVERIRPGDTLILGDRVRTQPMALEAGVACMVLTGGAKPTKDVLKLAADKGATIIGTEYDTYGAARLVNLSHRVAEVMATDMVLVSPEDLLSEVAEDLIASPHREAVVIEDGGSLAGIVTRTNLAQSHKRQVILVDHNEIAQSAEGIRDADVLEIVDHHRVGDVETAGPITFLGVPVGSTATIVAEQYRTQGKRMPRQIATLLLSAVLSDTVLLKSPTATVVDKAVVRRLASELEVDWTEFGMEMFRARSAAASFTAEKAFKADLKEYRAGDMSVAIGQVETVDLDEVLKHRDELLQVMGHFAEDAKQDLVLLMVTDVVREGTELLAVGKTRLAERAFGVTLDEGSAWLPGVLSRKKQVAARLMGAGA